LKTNKPQQATITLDARTWNQLGDRPFHSLDITLWEAGEPITGIGRVMDRHLRTTTVDLLLNWDSFASIVTAISGYEWRGKGPPTTPASTSPGPPFEFLQGPYLRREKWETFHVIGAVRMSLSDTGSSLLTIGI
jgi:hypothetical protein